MLLYIYGCVLENECFRSSPSGDGDIGVPGRCGVPGTSDDVFVGGRVGRERGQEGRKTILILYYLNNR